MKIKTGNQRVRLINFRKAFIAFLGLAIGILIAYAFFVFDTTFTKVILYASIILISVSIVLSIVWLCIKNRNRVLDSKFIFSLIFSIAFIIGFALTNINLLTLSRTVNFNGEGLITAEVNNVVEYEYGTSYTLDNISISQDGEIISLVSKGKLYISNSNSREGYKIGDKLEFYGEIISNNINNNDELGKVINGVGFNIIYSDQDNNYINLVQNNHNLRNNILNKILSTLKLFMSESNANLSYSMLFGDINVLDNEIKEMYTITGVMHILAVSGSNVAILGAVAYFIVNKLTKVFKLGKNWRNCITIISTFMFLLMYTYLCSFTVSVCRASIMFMVFILCRCCGFKYDSLSSLSIAGVIMLILSPLSLFDVGFQLSFLCILALITLVPKVLKITSKWRIPVWLASPFVVSICINLVIFPVLINVFGEASLISVIANIIVVPFFEFIYTILFAFSIISTIFNFIGWILVVPEILLHLLNQIISWFALVPNAVLKCFEIGYVVLALVMLFAFLYKYLMCSKKVKLLINSCIVIIAITVSIINSLPSRYIDNHLMLRQKYNNTDCLLVGTDVSICVGVPTSSINDFVYNLRLKSVDILVLNEFTMLDLNVVNDFVDNCEVSTIYLSNEWRGCISESMFNDVEIKYFDKVVESADFKIEFLYNYAYNYLGMSITTSNSKVLFVGDKLTGGQYSFLGSEWDEVYDYIVTNDVDVEFYNYDIEYKNIIYTTKTDNANDEIVLNNTKYCDIKL